MNNTKIDNSRGWFGIPKKKHNPQFLKSSNIVTNGKCALCHALTTRKDKEGNWVDRACEEAFIKERKGELYVE